MKSPGPVLLALGALALVAGCGSPADQPSASAGRDIALTRDGHWIEARVPRNATLESLLRQNNLSVELTASLVASVRQVFNPRELRANQMYRVTRSFDGLFREFRYQIDADRLLRVLAQPPAAGVEPAFSAEVVALPREIELDAISAEIGAEHSSLVGTLDALGENIQLALALADIFAGEVDFNSDLQNGDRFEALFERATRHGEFLGYGEIRAAVLETGGRRITAVRFADADGKPGYYDEQGRSLKRQFLKSPLACCPRLTSRFSFSRRNPVHGTVRAHLGVDYGAPVGTAVRAVAAGVVDFAGFSGEAGRMVRLRHGSGYQTAYLHLSALGPGIREGARVDQGDMIGRVGATGTATGPHLDYRIIKNGVYVNPLAELQRMPKGDPIDPSALAAYGRQRDEALAELRTRLAPAPGGPR